MELLKERVLRHRDELMRLLAAGTDGLTLGRANAQFLDGLMQEVFAAAGAPPAGLSLAAVGSFGRGAVALRSDADVRLLAAPRSKARAAAASFAEKLLYPLWDAGVSVGHQVLDGDEALSLAKEDVA